MAHWRLKIQDLSDRANQPYQKNNKYLLYNGEIYNFKNIKKKLKTKFKFKLLEIQRFIRITLYKVLKNLEEIRGMFGFVYFDEKKQIVAARDRFGQNQFFISKMMKN